MFVKNAEKLTSIYNDLFIIKKNTQKELAVIVMEPNLRK